MLRALPVYPDPNASELAAAADRGKAFLRLFLQCERRFYGFILTLLPNRADADDVLQDASLTMWDKFEPHNPPDDFAAWGCRIAYFKVLDYCKKRQRSRLVFSEQLLERLAETVVEHADALHLDERREALSGCIGKLRARDRELLARRFAAEADVVEIASAYGRSADAIYKSLAKIRQILFDCVTRTLAAERNS